MVVLRTECNRPDVVSEESSTSAKKSKWENSSDADHVGGDEEHIDEGLKLNGDYYQPRETRKCVFCIIISKCIICKPPLYRVHLSPLLNLEELIYSLLIYSTKSSLFVHIIIFQMLC